ncbi:hypothetical protein SAMN02745157_4030 [Kaistia soli DSM 19436]|uniref:DNA-binding transcriptional regulator, MarR family n=1 Tax=Kaistia soli DSM 19436 TaxID=1122133 RepID=A0A1M5IX73_9HYPH|nr:hypothetical protein [Kaistia soli]SHG32937.1 hypothetical protein SAMN02745157_4030 [Kaistia soli DSM 19436]
MTEQNSLDRLMEVFEILRAVDGLMPVQIAHSFVAIALHARITMEQLGLLVDLSQSACSRNVGTLGLGRSGERRGHGLVDVERDPEDARRFLMVPSEKGRRIARELAKAVGGDVPEGA